MLSNNKTLHRGYFIYQALSFLDLLKIVLFQKEDSPIPGFRRVLRQNKKKWLMLQKCVMFFFFGVGLFFYLNVWPFKQNSMKNIY